MNEDKIQNQINEVVETSPAETKVEASKPIEAPSYSTLRTGMPEEMQTAPVAQYETTPDRGIEFTKDTDEVITGGTAIPGLGYDTRFQTVDDMGDPLYFEPNLQPVVPYPLGPMETDTLNPNKANWQLMKNNFGARDQDYIGYYLLPEQGSLSWWDFFGGQVNKDIGMLVPRTLQGATGVITSALKMPFLGAAAYQSGDYKNIEPDPKLQQILKGAGLQGKDWAPMIDRIRTIAPESDTGSLFNELMKQSPSEAVRLLNQLQDIVDGAVSPLDETATLLYDADPEDKSFKAQSARAIGSGYTTFGSAALSKIPEVMFTLYNFAGAGQLRRNALNYGVSPSWAEVYSIGGSAVNSMLDMVEFAGLVNSGSLLKQGGVKALENLKNKGILKAIGRHAPREAVATGGEIVVESAQTGIEGAYDEDFREHPLDALVLSGLSVMALKIGTLPVSVRHANAEERAKVAEYLGVDKIYNAILKDSVAFADDLISKGALEPSQKQAFLDDMWANAPDTVIKTLREGVKGELDKIPANEIKNFAQILKDVNRNYQGQVFSPKTIMKLDQEVETNIANIRNGLSDSEIDMMKGVVRGAYVLSAIANANNPDYKGFQVPTFVITKNRDGYSYYDQKKNEIGLHEGRSNTEYTNNSPTYAARLDSGFVPASRQSDKMASILHEMSHWMDSMVGEKGFGDFLEYYYNSIATAFGKDTARRLYTQSEIKNKSKGRPREYFAQTIGRMGKRAAEAFGLGKSQANRFLSYANIMMNQLANLEGRAGEKLSQSIADFQTALQEVTKANMQRLSDLIEVYGSDNIKQALANFNKDSEGYGDFAEYLANQDMLKELFDVMDSFSDAAGLDKIKDLFDGDQKAMDNFVTMGDKLFRDGYDKAVEEVRQRRAEAKKTAPKPVEAKRDLNNPLVLRDLIVSETDDSSKVREEGVDYEQVAYASTRGPLEGEHLDADRYYATGEARGHKGRAMRWGYGNYLNKSPVINKENYYDSFLSDALKRPRSKLHGFPRGVPDLEMDMLVAYLETKAKPGESVIYKKDDIIKELNQGVEEAKQNAENSHKEFEKAYEAAKKYSKYYEFLGAFVHEPTESQMINMLSSDFYDTISESDAKKLFGVIDGYSFEEFKKAHEAAKKVYDSRAQDFRTHDQVAVEERMKHEIEECLTDESSIEILPEEKVVMPEQHAFLIPDNEYFLDAQSPIGSQTKFVKDKINKIAEKYGWWDSEFILNPVSGAYDVDVSEVNGEEFYNWLAKNVALEQGLSDKVEAYRFARDVLADSGIKGIRTFGHRDMETFNVFRSEDTRKYKQLHEEGATDYETQDWARAAMAKDSIKESFEAGKKPKKQIAADTVINGNDLSADITLAQQGLSKRLANPMNKVVKWAASSPWGWGLDRILVTVLGRDAAEHLDVQGKYSVKQNIRSKYWDEFMERLKPVLGNPENTRAIMFRYKTMVNNLGFVRMKGLEVINPTNPEITSTRDITGWEAMYVYLMQQQGFGDRVQKGTTTKIDDIIATLSDDEKAFAMAMSDQLMSMYEKTFGKSKYAHYFPILDAEHELFGELSIDSLTARQNTDDTIAIADAGRIFSQYVSRWASHESGYFQTLKRVRDIFRYTGNDQFGPEYVFDAEQDAARMRASAQVADMTRQAIGEDGYRNLLNNVNSELAEPQEQMFDATRNHTLTQMGNNIIKSILANKAVSFPKNVANLFMFWGGAKDQGRYWNSFAEGWGHMKDTYKYMMEHSGEIKQRWGSAGGINEYIDQRSLGGSTAPVMKGVSKIFAKMEWNGDKTQNMAKFSAAMDMLGDAGLRVFMQSGDMIANVFGGYALVKDYMAQGLSEADAFKKLDRYIVEHQSSSNLAMKPLVQKQFNRSILGQLFAFTSEGVAKWASILGTFDEANMGTATKSEAVANVVSIAISMALYSAIAAGAWDLLDDDEKVREEAEKALVNTAIDQVFGGLVAGNAMITPAISYLVGDSRISGMSVPIYNFALDGITALKKGDYDRVLFKALSAAGLPIGADNVWTSLFGASLLNDPNPDVRYAGALMLAGFTPNRATKRAGIKKESLEKNDEE